MGRGWVGGRVGVREGGVRSDEEVLLLLRLSFFGMRLGDVVITVLDLWND